jgi:tetratricopeptide (TPR) repeat protein
VQLAQAFYQYWVLRDDDAAQHTFERLRTKLPNTFDIPEALGMIARRQGRWEESRALADEAVALNPRDLLMRLEAAWTREMTRDFPGALRSYDEALSISPDDANTIRGKVEVYQALGELDHADALLERLHPTVGSDTGFDTICYQARLRRRYSGAIKLVQTLLDQAASLPTTTLIQQKTLTSYRWALADLQQLSGDAAKAKTGLSQVRDAYEQLIKEQPDNTGELSLTLAIVYADLGDRERALAFSERAVNTTPRSKDVLFALKYENTRAYIATRFGDKDLAIPVLERLLKMPGDLPPLTPALLRLDPDYDSLRGDPRFQKLCQEKSK